MVSQLFLHIYFLYAHPHLSIANNLHQFIISSAFQSAVSSAETTVSAAIIKNINIFYCFKLKEIICEPVKHHKEWLKSFSICFQLWAAPPFNLRNILWENTIQYNSVP